MSAPDPPRAEASNPAPESAPATARGSHWQMLQLLSAILSAVAAVVLVGPLIAARLQGVHLTSRRVLTPFSAGAGQSSEHLQGEGAGALLVIDSDPPGAEVSVAGEVLGRTPLSTELHCAAGARLGVEIKSRGYTTHHEDLTCTPNTLARIEARLRRR
jgi:hypothetical protein